MRSRESQIYSAHPVERLLRILEALSFWHASTHWFVKSLTIFLPSSKFGRLVRRKAFLLCKNPCGWAAMGDGGPHRNTGSPRAKKFPEEICFAPSRVLQVCRTPDYRAFKSTQARSTGTTVRTGQPGVPEGPLPLCLGRSPEETLSRVSFGQFLRGGSTPRFFAQLRSVGSNHPAGRSLPV